MKHVEVLRELRAHAWKDAEYHSKGNRDAETMRCRSQFDALDAAIRALSAPQSVACAHEAWEENAGWNRCVDCGHGWASASPPSAPVGVEWAVIVEGLRLADQFFDGDDNHWQWDDGEAFPASKVRTAYQAALAQQPAAVDGATTEKIALLFTRSGKYFVGQDERNECLEKARKAIALAAQQPAAEPYKALFVAAMNTAEQAMDYVQNNPDKFDARPGDDKLAIICREFLKAQQLNIAKHEKKEACARAERLSEALQKLAAHVRPTCSVLWDEAQAALRDYDKEVGNE